MLDAPRMRPLDALIPFDEARRRWMATLRPTERHETVPFEQADGRILARDVRAPIDVPGFDRSAMDGYAVRTVDVARAANQQPARLRVRARIHAGPAKSLRIGPGECAQIATGAAIPNGADAVVMVEHTTRAAGDQVDVLRPVGPGENISPKGGDLRQGSPALAKGSRLNPARIAVLAALGLKTADVHDTPRVTLLSTGSELRTAGQNLRPGLIYDSNSSALTTLLRRNGARVEHAGIIPDDPDTLRKALQRTKGQDLVLVTGSSSAGERDHLVPVLQDIGRIDFHGVHVRPGKPLLLGRLGDTPLLGLAGNPASCLLMTEVLVVPWIRAFQQLPPDPAPPTPARLGHDVASPKGRRHFLPVRVQDGQAESVYRESDATTSLSRADGYIEIADDVERLSAGTQVQVHPF